MKYLKLAAATLVAAVFGSATGADYTLVSAPQSLADWRSGSFYSGEAAPPEDGTATVIVPKGLDAKVDDAAMEFAGKIYWFKVAQGAAVTFDVASDCTLNARVASGTRWSDFGKIRKSGNGELKLASTGKCDDGDYWVDVDVVAGSVDMAVAGHRYGRWTVAAGTKVKVHQGAYMLYGGLAGMGDVENADAGTCALSSDSATSDPAIFGGVIGERISFSRIGGHQHFTGIQPNLSGDIEISGAGSESSKVIFGLGKFGMVGSSDSSVGSAGTLKFHNNGGRLLYLGTTEETTDKVFRYDQTTYGAGIDAGAYGGLTFSGVFRPYYADSAERFFLEGSNTVPCYVTGAWTSNSKFGGLTHITKTGTGSWRFSDYTSAGTSYNARDAISAVTIRNGTFGIESFNETNAVGSLGTTPYFVADKNVALASAEHQDHFFTLGVSNSTDVGTLEYYGGKRFKSETRPIVVAGSGRLLANGAAEEGGLCAYGSYQSGVSSRSDAGKLILDGANDSLDVLKNVTDGAGVLSVEKRGAGTWTLAGTGNTFTGPIDVKAGTLVLRGVSGKFTWYRMTFRATKGGAPLAVYKLGMWDGEGTHVNGNLKLAPGAFASDKVTGQIGVNDYYKVAPGEVCLGDAFVSDWNLVDERYALVGLFNTSGYFTYLAKKVGKPVEGQPETYFPIMFRLGRSIGSVVRYDVAQYYGYDASHQNQPQSWLLEGSVDGETWYVVDDVKESPEVPSPAEKWMYTGTTLAADPAATHKGGRAITGSTNDVVVTYANPVSVSGGATLEAEGLVRLSCLKIDVAATEGTIRGFQLAEDLTIDVSNAPRDPSFALPVAFDGVTGLANTENWTIKKDGKVTDRFTPRISNGKIYLDRGGMMILVR